MAIALVLICQAAYAIYLSRQEISAKYASARPKYWSEFQHGIKTRIDSSEEAIALTFDLCGNDGDTFDRELLDYILANEVECTVFVNSRWIDNFAREFYDISEEPFIEIENHGHRHIPLSVNGRKQYGIQGTASPAEVYDEIMDADEKIWKLTGRKPKFFRSGTAFYDDVAIRIASDLGYKIAGYSVMGNAQNTPADKVRDTICSAEPGSIILLHINRPGTGVSEGVMQAVPILERRGIKLVKLRDLPLK